jgi:protein SCO1/2
MRRRARFASMLLLAPLCAALIAVAPPSRAALTPRDVAGVAYDATPGRRLPAAAEFVDEHGTPVHLRDYLGARPLIVVPGYYGCSNLCSLVLAALDRSLAQAHLVAGRDAEVVVVSIAPLETPAMAAARKAAVLGSGDVAGWHFLTGPDASIAAFERALGFRAAYDASNGTFAHATGLMIAAPDGTLGALLPGIEFGPAALRAAIARVAAPSTIPAAHVRTVTAPAVVSPVVAAPAEPVAAPAAPVTRWLLCLHDDLASGRYNAAALAAVRGVGLAGLAFLAVLMLGRHRRPRVAVPPVRRGSSRRHSRPTGGAR